MEERREIQLRHARFNAALIVSVIYNTRANRGEDSPTLSPYDFLPGYEADPAQEEKDKLRRSIKHAIALAFMHLKTKSRDEVLAEKAKMIERMTTQGVEDPEGLIREVFPEL